MNALFMPDATLFARALVIGIFGGAGLLLGYRFSTRGAIMFPIYASILFVAALVMAQFPDLSFLARFRALMLAMFVATAMSLAGVLYSARQRDKRRAAADYRRLKGMRPGGRRRLSSRLSRRQVPALRC